MKRAFSATLVAFALMFLPAIVPIPESIAQAPTPAPAPEVRTSKINLTVEQRHIIRELVREQKVAPAAIDAKVAAGDPVPQQVELHPIPQLIGQKVPQVKSHRFFVTREQIVLVDPNDNRIADVIEE